MELGTRIHYPKPLQDSGLYNGFITSPDAQMTRETDMDTDTNTNTEIDILSYDPPFIPNKLRPDYLPRFKSDLPESVKTYVRELINKGWKIYAVDQSRGRCYYYSKVITIPTWAINKGTSYFTWYVSHECAHAYNYINKTCDSHGPNFMEWLKRICPENDIIHELGYKPRNAAAAGIGKTPFLEL